MLYYVITVLYETSKLNKIQLYMECSHFCKQHHLECVNIPETVNNSMQLGFDFLQNQLLIYSYLVDTKQEQGRRKMIKGRGPHNR